jgi:hypothetical protein
LTMILFPRSGNIRAYSDIPSICKRKNEACCSKIWYSNFQGCTPAEFPAMHASAIKFQQLNNLHRLRQLQILSWSPL